MATEYKTMPILISSPKYNIDILPVQMKNTHRFLLHYYHASYSSDVSLQFNIYYKKMHDDTEYMITMPLPYTQTYMKVKLPRFLLCREWRFEIVGTDVTNFQLYEAGIMWTPYLIGGR